MMSKAIGARSLIARISLFVATFVLAAVTALLLSGEGAGGTKTQSVNRNATLITSVALDIALRDPALSINIGLRRAQLEMYEGLVTKNWFQGSNRTTVVPALATRWRISPDGRTYTFFLRRGVR